MYPRRAIAVAPDILAAHCLLVRILVGAGRHEDAVKAIEAVMELPTPSEAFSWTDGLIVDASQCAAKALDALNRDDDKGPLIRRVTERYPKLEPMLAQVRQAVVLCGRKQEQPAAAGADARCRGIQWR